jgi:hypothetical protein
MVTKRAFGRRRLWYLPGDPEENKDIFSQEGRFPDEVRTEHLPNTSLEGYRYANPLG